MKRDFIINEIKRTAEHGRALGKARFYNETGIKESDWYGIYWTKWSDAIIEAGFAPNEKQQSLPKQFMLSKLAEFALEIGKFPTTGELKMKARNDKDFPSRNTYAKFGNKSNLAKELLNYALENDINTLIPLCEIEITQDPEIDEEGIQNNEEYGSVYLYKAGTHYKIGRTNNLERRNREIKLHLPFEAELIHRIMTDDPIGIEKYWHERFSDKRLHGEWFKLNAQDIKAFRRRKFM